MDKILNQLIEAIKDQQEIFGDELFENVRKTKIHLPNQPAPQNKIDMTKTLNVPVPSIPFEIQKPISEMQLEEFTKATDLVELNNLICNCLKCPLGKTRNKFVFGVGNPKADIMLIGEGPGADEDMQGEPFVGRAGKLLNDILKAIQLEREEVYIANIVKCRPPGNRNPLPEEMEKCLPYLYKQIEIIRPKLILCLGLISATALLKTKQSLTKLRGEVYEVKTARVMVTYHPAALLRNPQWKRGCWEDVQKFKELYDSIKA